MKLKGVLAAGAAVAAALVATAASAQTSTTATAPATPAADAPERLEVEEIVVTAERRSQSLQTVPVAVSVVSGEALQRSNIATIEDLSSRLPAVKITSGALAASINIRGVGSGSNPGFEQSVATFVDDIYRNRARSMRAALFDVERVEVLKGPQTTFFGANAVAGALNITTRKPGKEFDYNGVASYGSYGEYTLEGGVSVPVSDTVRLRAAGRLSGQNGYVDTPNGRGPRQRDELARVSARFEPTSNFQSDLRIDYGHSNITNAYPFELLNCPAPAPFAVTGTACGRFIALRGTSDVDDTLNWRSDAPYSFARYRFGEAAWTHSLDLGFATLAATTGYYQHRYQQRINQIVMPITGTVRGYDPYPGVQDEHYRSFSQELRLQSDTAGPIEYMVGGYFSQDRLHFMQYSGFFFNAFGANPILAATGTTADTPLTARQNFRQTARTLSGFGSLTFKPVDGLRLNLGGRYTSVHKEARRALDTFGTSVNADPASFVLLSPATNQAAAQVLVTDLFQYPRPERTDNKFMPSAGIQYDVTPTIMTYVSYTKGFKAGGYSFSARALDFDPETVNAYEIGIKSRLFERRLTLNVAAFQSDYKNLQETVLQPLGAGTVSAIVANAAATRARGIEGSATLRLLQELTINADLSYLDSRYRNYSNGACTIQQGLVPGCIQSMSGKRRAFAPEFSGNIGLSAAIPAGSYRISVDPSVYFSSAYFQSATADPLLRQSAYTKLDLRVALAPTAGRWELALIGKNLTDRITAGYRQPVSASNGSVFALPDPPRTIAVQFTIHR